MAVGLYLLILMFELAPAATVEGERSDRCGRDAHFQSRYCAADFVVKASIQSARPIATAARGLAPAASVMYEFALKTQFKVTEKFLKLDESRLKQLMAVNSSGTQMQIGQKYLITGKINAQRQLTTSDCEKVQLWEEVSPRIKGYLHKQLLDRNCVCQIANSVADWSESSGSESAGACSLMHAAQLEIAQQKKHKIDHLTAGDKHLHLWSAQVSDCYKQHSFCALRAASRLQVKCAWSRNADLKQCLNSLKEVTYQIQPLT